MSSILCNVLIKNNKYYSLPSYLADLIEIYGIIITPKTHILFYILYTLFINIFLY